MQEAESAAPATLECWRGHQWKKGSGVKEGPCEWTGGGVLETCSQCGEPGMPAALKPEPDDTAKAPGRARRFRPDQEFELLAARGMTGGWIVIEGPEEWRTAELEWAESLTTILEVASDKIRLFHAAGGDVSDRPVIPDTPGLYRLRFAFRFEPGQSEGYPAPGECDWSFEPLAIRRRPLGSDRSSTRGSAEWRPSSTVAQGAASDLAAIVRVAMEAGWTGEAGGALAEWLRETFAAHREELANLKTLADLFTEHGWGGDGIEDLVLWLRERLAESLITRADRLWTPPMKVRMPAFIAEHENGKLGRQEYEDATVGQPCTCREKPGDRSFADPAAHEPACAWRRQEERMARARFPFRLLGGPDLADRAEAAAREALAGCMPDAGEAPIFAKGAHVGFLRLLDFLREQARYPTGRLAFDADQSQLFGLSFQQLCGCWCTQSSAEEVRRNIPAEFFRPKEDAP